MQMKAICQLHSIQAQISRKMMVSVTAKLLPSVTKKITANEDDEKHSSRYLKLNGGRRSALLILAGASWPQALIARAADGEEEEGILSSITSLLDPNEKTKSGKVLPKAYLNSAREVVRTLRDSLKEDSKDNAKFRRNADAAKESIREYLGNWRGQQAVSKEESYMELEKAIRDLAGFYSKAGPSAALPEDVKTRILNDLTAAEQSL
ncbi:unnamed protein product [Rhodiola kirilowii]